MVIDPVCKMQIDENKAAAISKYEGQKYYFCAQSCRKAFDSNPERYTIIDTITKLIKRYHESVG
jgi:YHS domain-containing protein